MAQKYNGKIVYSHKYYLDDGMYKIEQIEKKNGVMFTQDRLIKLWR